MVYAPALDLTTLFEVIMNNQDEKCRNNFWSGRKKGETGIPFIKIRSAHSPMEKGGGFPPLRQRGWLEGGKMRWRRKAAAGGLGVHVNFKSSCHNTDSHRQQAGGGESGGGGPPPSPPPPPDDEMTITKFNVAETIGG